jgi:uncharacterized Zn-binding protein involved in type VI secretion
MARPAARDGDMDTGHGPFNPRTNIAKSPNVFINGKGAIRKGDAFAIHCVGSSCHGGAAKKGSGTVFINGQDAMRIGDPIDCGSFIAQGSGNVFIGK